MRNTWYSTAVASAVALLFVAGGALAQTKSPGTMGGSDTGKSPGSSATRDHGSPSTSAAGDFTARHTMEGQVTNVDHQKGMVTLKTDEGTLSLHFPPSALQNVKQGDRISVELAMKPAGAAASPSSEKPPAASPKTEPSPKGDLGKSGGGSSGSSEKKY